MNNEGVLKESSDASDLAFEVVSIACPAFENEMFMTDPQIIIRLKVMCVRLEMSHKLRLNAFVLSKRLCYKKGLVL